MSKHLAFAFVVVVPLVLCAHASAARQAGARPAASAEEYAVYSAYIGEKYVRDKTKMVVIANPQSGPSPSADVAGEVGYLSERLAPLSKETYDDYRGRLREGQRLGRAFPLRIKYALVDYVEIERLFEEPDLDAAWATFYKRYPGSNGYVMFSRVGFNAAKDQALFSASWMCNTRCGAGAFVLLTKRGGAWKVENLFTQWVS